MTRDQFCHFKHGDLTSSIEDGSQRTIRIDVGHLFRVLKIVRLDIVPDSFCQFCAGKWGGTNYCRQSIIRLDRVKECCVHSVIEISVLNDRGPAPWAILFAAAQFEAAFCFASHLSYYGIPVVEGAEIPDDRQCM